MTFKQLKWRASYNGSYYFIPIKKFISKEDIPSVAYLMIDKNYDDPSVTIETTSESSYLSPIKNRGTEKIL